MNDPYRPASEEFVYEDVFVSDKKRLLAFLLAFFFGVFGVHRFYVGKVGTGILMVLLDLTLIGLAVTGIWSLVDAIIIACGEFTDAEGAKLIDWT